MKSAQAVRLGPKSGPPRLRWCPVSGCAHVNIFDHVREATVQHQDHFAALKKEVLEIQDRHSGLSPDNAFVAWYLRAFIVDDEASQACREWRRNAPRR
jgi:hypothetical protein